MSRSRHHARRGFKPKHLRKESALNHRFLRGREMVTDEPLKERSWLSGCVGKVRYASERIAEVRRLELEALHGRKFRTYECHFCGQLHLATEWTAAQHQLMREIRLLERHLRERGIKTW